MSTIPTKIPSVVGAVDPPAKKPTVTELALETALTRFLAGTSAPSYLRAAGTSWLAALHAK